uniref:Metalloendopeptidase n=1 Tax=Plectus sambesii TaxID=2011161 RepID=A0A914VBM6_9BILA
MKAYAKFCLLVVVLACGLTVFVDGAPIPPDHELRQHFPSLSNNDFAEMTNLLDQIKQVAHDRFYGKDSVAVAQHSTDMRPSVSISIAQPGVQVPISRYLFEGDILLSPLQANVILRNLLRVLRKNRRRRSSWPALKQLITSSSMLLSRDKRSLYSSEKARWKNFPIQYTFHDSLSVDAVTEIGLAIDYWMNHTCLTFEKVSEPERDYIEFFRGQGCYSMIGRVGGRQGVSIGDGCERTGTIEHEIGHALGLWHEQARPDADCCIVLEPDNIINNFISDFLQRSWEEVLTYGIPYDMGSVMHYGSTAFTNDWSKKTVLTRDARYQRTIGQRERLSFYDVQVINKAYCPKHCDIDLPCFNGGYTHPGKCDGCICPDGFGGIVCDRHEQPKNAQCGGMLPALEQWAEITSPGYPHPGYNIDQKCSWILRAPQGKRVELEFIDRFQFFCTTTCLDFVEVKASADVKLTGFRYCCFERPTEAVVSELADMIVIFRSTVSRDVGFKARFRYS